MQIFNFSQNHPYESLGTFNVFNPTITSTQYSALKGTRKEKEEEKTHYVLKSGNEKIMLINKLTQCRLTGKGCDIAWLYRNMSKISITKTLTYVIKK